MKKKIMGFLTGLTIVSFMVLQLGCATTPFPDGVVFSSGPSGANVVIYDSSGATVFSGVTSSAKQKLNGKPPFRVEVTLRGYEPSTFEIRKENGKWVWGSSALTFDNGFYVSLRKTAETLAAEAAAKAEAEAREARRLAEAEAREKIHNPKGLDRAAYIEFSVSQFSFDMMAGNLAIGSKVFFTAPFSSRPTGTEYKFIGIDPSLRLITDHNFIQDIPEYFFVATRDSTNIGGRRRYYSRRYTVKIFVTVNGTGTSGSCSIDIIDWPAGFEVYN